MLRKIFIVILTISIVGAAVIYGWRFISNPDPLAFQPPADQPARYHLTITKTILDDDQMPTNIESTLNIYARVVLDSADEEGYTFTVTADQVVLSNSKRTIIDSNSLADTRQEYRQLAALLTKGLKLHTDANGAFLSSEFIDTDLADELSETLQEKQLAFMKRYLGRVAVQAAGFPDSSLEEGLSWSGKMAMTGPTSPTFQYRVDAMDTDTVSIAVDKMVSQGASSSGTAAGYILVDRKTGMPMKSFLAYMQPSDYYDEAKTEYSQLRIRRMDQPPFAATESYKDRLYTALYGFDVDTQDKNFAKYFLPPYGAQPANEVLELLNDLLVWSPRDKNNEESGLHVPAKLLLSNVITPLEVTGVQLLDKKGNAMPGPSLNPAFDITAFVDIYDRTYKPPRSKQLFSSPLTDKQLSALDEIALTVQSSIQGELVEGELTRDSKQIALNEELTVTVDSWQADRIALSLSRPSGFSASDWTFLAAIPQDKNGKPIASFHVKTSHEAIEKILKNPAFDEPKETDAYYTDFIDNLQIQSPLASRGDLLIYIDLPEPASSISLSVAPLHLVEQTWRAKNIGNTLQGGKVVGERLLDESAMRDLEYPELDMSEVSAKGTEHHQLKLNLPSDSLTRCQVMLDGPATYQDHGFSLKPRGYDADLQLVTDNGVTFFYDLDLKVAVDCATRIESIAIDIDNSDWAKRIDENTVELSVPVWEQLIQLESLTSRTPTVIGRRADGAPLKPLKVNDTSSVNRRYRFWGEVKTLSIPRITDTDSLTIDVNFAPLP